MSEKMCRDMHLKIIMLIGIGLSDSVFIQQEISI